MGDYMGNIFFIFLFSEVLFITIYKFKTRNNEVLTDSDKLCELIEMMIGIVLVIILDFALICIFFLGYSTFVSNVPEHYTSRLLNANSTVCFEDGSSESTLGIKNLTSETVQAEIITKDTSEVIYRSELLPRGGFVEQDKLNTDLEPGTYECEVVFYGLGDTGAIEEFGTKDMTITVEH